MRAYMSMNFLSTGGNYSIPPVTFTPGQKVGTQQCAMVSMTRQGQIEDEESFTLALSVPESDRNSVRFTTERNATTVTIIRDINYGESMHA